MDTMTNSPIFTAALAAWKANPSRAAYVNTNDTAKAIRAILKAKFPGTKFSVRGSKYSGGSSIRVSWTDGPTAKLVDAYVQPFSGAGFDGMNDMKFYKEAWLYPNGTASFASTRGTEGSAGVVPAADEGPASDGAVPVSFSADFVFTERSYSDAARDRVLQAYAYKWGDPLAEAIRAGKVKEFWEASAYECNAPAPAPHMGDCYLNQMAARRMLPQAVPA